VLAHYQASDWRADRVIMTGDLIQDDTAEAYERFRDLLLPLDLRIHCVPGNHDIRDLMRAVCCRPPFSYCAYEEFRDWLIVGIDSCIRGHAGGEVAGDELDRLSEIVGRSSARHVMVCLHHPPVPVGSKWLDSVGLRNGDELLDRLRSLNRVRLATFGHIHQEYDAEHHGIRIIGTPSTCRQFEPGSEKFAVDDNPPAYRKIMLNTDGSVDTEVVWVGE
jgi:Icc protein